jgi:hypothetical protein
MGSHRLSTAKSSFLIAILLLLLPVFRPNARAAQTPPAAQQEPIGRLAGDDVLVKGAITFDHANGRTTAVLASGSELTLRSGQAKIDLTDGGDIIVCGPAQLSVVKSGPALTIALDYGQIHLQMEQGAQVTIFTPLMIAKPLAIADRELDLTLGIDSNGELCAAPVSGAIRIEEQFTGKTVVIPQGAGVEISGGRLAAMRAASRKCSCELFVSQNETETDVTSVPHSPENAAGNRPKPAPHNDSAEAPYRIEVPLSFNSSSMAPDLALRPYSEAVLIIRDSVSNMAASFRGVIRPDLPKPSRTALHSNSKPGLLTRLFGMFRHHGADPAQRTEN